MKLYVKIIVCVCVFISNTARQSMYLCCVCWPLNQFCDAVVSVHV